MNAITINNVGPIEHAELPCPEGGGIVVLKGQQGVGKTTALEAMNVAAGSKGSVVLRDRQAVGGVDAFGVTLKIGRNVRRAGEVEVVSLEGKFSVGDLIDPGILDQAAADARRIKALVQLSGAAADPALFHSLFKGGVDEFVTIVDASVLKMTDLVSMADRIKRDCEATARKTESEAQHLEGKAASGRTAIAEINFNGKRDPEILQALLEAALNRHTRLCEKADAATQAEAAAIDARKKLEAARASGSQTMEQAHQRFADKVNFANEKHAELIKWDSKVAEMEAMLRDLKGDRRQLATEAESAAADVRSAIENRNHVEANTLLLKDWQATIDAAANVERIDADAIDGAELEVAKCREALEQGAIIRNAIKQKQDADDAAQEAKDKLVKASLLRNAARGTDDVLSAIVAKLGTPLRVEGGRLILDTPRGPTLFAELSDGERSKLAYSLGIKIVGNGGFFTIPQWAFGELQPANKLALNEEAKAANVLIYTAEATDDKEMVAEIM